MTGITRSGDDFEGVIGTHHRTTTTLTVFHTVTSTLTSTSTSTPTPTTTPTSTSTLTSTSSAIRALTATPTQTSECTLGITILPPSTVTETVTVSHGPVTITSVSLVSLAHSNCPSLALTLSSTPSSNSSPSNTTSIPAPTISVDGIRWQYSSMSDPATSPRTPSNNSSALAGLVVGVLGIITALCALLLVFMQRRRPSSSTDHHIVFRFPRLFSRMRKVEPGGLPLRLPSPTPSEVEAYHTSPLREKLSQTDGGTGSRYRPFGASARTIRQPVGSRVAGVPTSPISPRTSSGATGSTLYIIGSLRGSQYAEPPTPPPPPPLPGPLPTRPADAMFLARFKQSVRPPRVQWKVQGFKRSSKDSAKSRAAPSGVDCDATRGGEVHAQNRESENTMLLPSSGVHGHDSVL